MSSMKAIGAYLGRVLVFNWIWALTVTVLSFVAQVLLPDPNFVPFWFLALAPLGYVLGALTSTPIALAIGILTWALATRSTFGRRSSAILATIGAWTVVLVWASTAGPYDSLTIVHSAIDLGVSIPLFAALMPLPRAPRAESETGGQSAGTAPGTDQPRL
jgi:hypothetical protein